jgi:hypothetical protein
MSANPRILDPLLSDFETQEQADSYDRWFRAKVQKSLDTDRALFVPHEEVAAELERMFADLEAQERKHATG